MRLLGAAGQGERAMSDALVAFAASAAVVWVVVRFVSWLDRPAPAVLAHDGPASHSRSDCSLGSIAAYASLAFGSDCSSGGDCGCDGGGGDGGGE